MKGKPRVETAGESYFRVFSVPVCLVASFAFKALRHRHGRLLCVCFITSYAQLFSDVRRTPKFPLSTKAWRGVDIQ